MIGQLSPSDAAAAARSFPRRWRSLFALVLDEEEADDVMLGERTDGSPSALALAGRAADGLAATADRLRLTMREHRPALGRDPAPRSPAEPEIVLASLEEAADDLARTIDEIDAARWNRPATLHGEQVTALEVLRAGIEEASALLRQAERTLEEVVRRQR